MRRSVAVVVGVVVLTGVLLWWHEETVDVAGTASAPRETTAPARSSVERAPRRTADAPAPGDVDSEPEEALPNDVHGVVLDEDDHPIAGAHVRLFRMDGREHAGRQIVDLEHPLASSQTSADGTFRFGDDVPGEVVVVASHRGLVPCSDDIGASRGHEIVLHLVAEKVRKFRVVDERGSPIPHAEFIPLSSGYRIALSPVHTDAEGRATFGTGRELALIVQARGFVTMRVEVHADESESEVDEVVMRRGLGVEGVVVDEKGKPLPGVRVWIDAPADEMEGVEHTGPDGGFAFEGLDPRRDSSEYAIFADLAGRGMVTGPLVPGDHDIRIVLRPPTLVRGVVFFADGQPAADALVGPSIHADSTGRFELGGFAPGEVVVRAHAALPSDPRAQVEGSAVVVVPESGVVDDVRIVLGPPKTSSYVLVRVTSDVRLPNVRLVAWLDREEVGDAWVPVNEPSLLRVRQPAGTHVTLGASGGSSAQVAVEVTTEPVVLTRAEPPFEQVELKLGAAPRLRLKLVDPEDREIPLDPAHVRVAARFVGDGTYELSAVQPVQATLTVPGFSAPNVYFEPPHPPLREEIVHLEPGVRVVGRVLTAEGRPAPSSIRVGVQIDTEFGWESDSESLDAEGRFEVASLPHGTLRLRVFDGDDVLDFRTFEIGVGAAVDVGDLHLGERHAFRGIVVDEKGSGLGGAQVFFADAGDHVVCKPASTGPDGSFEITLVPPSTMRLRVERRGFATRLLDIAAKAPQPLRAVLLPGCRVRVLLEFRDAGWGHVEARIPGTDRNWRLRRVADSDRMDEGVFGIFDDVPPGPVTVVFITPRRQIVRVVEAVPGRTVDCTFER